MSVSFDVQVKEILDEYGDEAAEIVSECAEDIADKTVKQLKSAGQSHWKKFNRAWMKTVTKKRLRTEVTVHVRKPHYRIGHLLEFGHANRDGGRTQGYHFIEPVATEMEKEFVETLEEKL